MRKGDIKRPSLWLTFLMVVVLALMVPNLATAEWYTDSGLDSQIPENEHFELHFSTLYQNSDLRYSDDAFSNSYDERLGYWFQDIPWLPQPPLFYSWLVLDHKPCPPSHFPGL